MAAVATRREMLALAAALPAGADEVASLGEAAAAAGLRFGANSDCVITDEPPAYARLVQRHCTLFAPQFPWHFTGRRAEGPDPDWEDPNIGFARQNGLQLTGGHFLFHESVPAWFAAIDSPAAAERAITRHIGALGRAYAGAVFSWNVVNEAIAPRYGRADGLRPAPFLERFGEAYFDVAFQAARAADPAALLVVNDNGMEAAGTGEEQRRRALLGLLDRLLARRVPIDAVGLQAHLNLDDRPFDGRTYRGFLGEIAGRGLRILVTELDVLDDGRNRAIAARDAAIADRYAGFLAVALDEPAVVSLVTWGLSDRYTWLSPARLARLNLPPGPPRRPLPFDADFSPKPAYAAVLAALRAAPARPPAGRR